ncbi:MAG: PAS domain S-box protein [Balneolales bacterium]
MQGPDKPSLSKSKLAESLIKSQPGLFVLFDKAGNIHWWNTRLEHYSGFSNDQIKSLKVLDLVEESDRNALQRKIDEAFRKGMTDIEIRLKSKKGENIFFLFTWVAVDMDDTDYIIGTGIDITRLHLERSKKMRYYQALEKSRNEILMFDAETLCLVYVNKGARKNLGYSLKELKDMTATDIKPEFDEDKFRNFIQPLLNGKKEFLKYETSLLRSDGSRYKVEINLEMVESEDQKVLIGIVVDITDRMLKEKQTKASLREKELLLGEVHHRVKNNLAIVSSLLNMQSHNVKDESVKMLFDESISRVKAMTMIHQMLYEQEDFSELNFGLYLNRLISYISANHQNNVTSVETDITADNIKFDIITAVPCALIVNELITNAYKHACKGQERCLIKVSLTKKQNVNKLVVSDNGVGFPEKFNSENSAGMGLTLVRGLTDQLGGTLELHQDGGTIFKITFNTNKRIDGYKLRD